MSTPAAAPVQQLVALIREATGNVIPSARLGLLEEVAQRRAHARGLAGIAEYVQALAGREIDDEWATLVPLVTIKESYFFRAPQQFEAIRARVLPALLQARATARQLRIWCAACARGEEPATLAMLLADEPSLSGWEWTLVATDLDEDALAGARQGLYGERAVAQVPPRLRERWFSRRGNLFELDAGLRSRIQYQPLNLARAPFLLPFSQCDLVLLRNVLIYFRRPLQRWVVSQMAGLLAPEGYLFLGATETLWQIQEELEAVDLGPCFAYRHRTTPPAAKLASPPRRSPAARPSAPPVPPRRPSPPPPVAAARLRLVPPAVDIAVIQPCEVFDRLLTASRDLAANRIDEAARTVGQVLATDPSEPAAHALEGFVHDLCGRSEEAVASYRAALYLDPGLFQVRILLADCLLRLGHRERAEHQYREVLTLLAGGRERALLVSEELPLPDRERAQRRCRQVLKG